MGFLIAIVVLGLAWTVSYLWLNRAFAAPVETSNPEGPAGRALVVDHPGRGSFHVQVVSGYVEGLLYYWMRPNDHDNYADTAQNKALAVRMAAQAAQALSLPVQDAGDGEPV
jgi:hypothetical protein